MTSSMFAPASPASNSRRGPTSPKPAAAPHAHALSDCNLATANNSTSSSSSSKSSCGARKHSKTGDSSGSSANLSGLDSVSASTEAVHQQSSLRTHPPTTSQRQSTTVTDPGTVLLNNHRSELALTSTSSSGDPSDPTQPEPEMQQAAEYFRPYSLHHAPHNYGPTPHHYPTATPPSAFISTGVGGACASVNPVGGNHSASRLFVDGNAGGRDANSNSFKYEDSSSSSSSYFGNNNNTNSNSNNNNNHDSSMDTSSSPASTPTTSASTSSSQRMFPARPQPTRPLKVEPGMQPPPMSPLTPPPSVVTHHRSQQQQSTPTAGNNNNNNNNNLGLNKSGSSPAMPPLSPATAAPNRRPSGSNSSSNPTPLANSKFRYPSGPSNSSSPPPPATPSSAMSSREGTPIPGNNGGGGIKVEDPAPNVDISQVSIADRDSKSALISFKGESGAESVKSEGGGDGAGVKNEDGGVGVGVAAGYPAGQQQQHFPFSSSAATSATAASPYNAQYQQYLAHQTQHGMHAASHVWGAGHYYDGSNRSSMGVASTPITLAQRSQQHLGGSPAASYNSYGDPHGHAHQSYAYGMYGAESAVAAHHSLAAATAAGVASAAASGSTSQVRKPSQFVYIVYIFMFVYVISGWTWSGAWRASGGRCQNRAPPRPPPQSAQVQRQKPTTRLATEAKVS